MAANETRCAQDVAVALGMHISSVSTASVLHRTCPAAGSYLEMKLFCVVVLLRLALVAEQRHRCRCYRLRSSAHRCS